MPTYNVVFSCSFEVTASDQQEAEDYASALAEENYGRWFAKDAGCIVEEIE